ncbi:MAG: NAD(P)-binding protein [Symploca sp. SIO2C1]|nr:NAD(P)-binding protein [Symploca sp. SIO2C1]
MTQTTKPRVLISGAGIAGLTAAYWLVQQGWKVVILEKADTLRKGEYVIDFAGTGWDVAVKMGLDDALRARQTPIRALCFQDHQSYEKARLSMQDFVELMGVADKFASINRRDLQELLYELVQSHIEVRFSSSIHSLKERETGEGVDVILQDGTAEHYDLVIGADGLHSNVRALAFGEEVQFARYLGYHVAAFRISGVAGDEPGLMSIMRIPNKQAGILDLGDGDSLALFVYAKESNAYVPRKQRKQVLIETFGEMGGMVPAILHSIDDSTSIYMDTATQIELPTWHSQRITLIGDAAYCLTLISGQGASMAMGGAYVLAMAMGTPSTNNIESALAEYEARLRPFVEELQNKTRRLASSFVPTSQFDLWMNDFIVRWLHFSWVKRYVAKQFSLQSLFEREALAKR